MSRQLAISSHFLNLKYVSKYSWLFKIILRYLEMGGNLKINFVLVFNHLN